MAGGSEHDDEGTGGESIAALRSSGLLLHEIRQPLAAVFALAEAARSRPGVPADVDRYLERIVEQTREIADAVTSVLDRRATDTGPVDLDEVVDSVLSAFAHTWSGTLSRRGARRDLVVHGDRATVRRCLVNVVDNAVRAAGPRGSVTVTVRRDATSVRVLVEDDGPGFGFVPGGSGLGLPVTRQEVEAMGGRLATGLPSSHGGGRVAISLPLRPTSRHRSTGSTEAPGRPLRHG
ncbi:sensor histidine kinase [Geodermatophilus sp. SYSU D00710]